MAGFGPPFPVPMARTATIVGQTTDVFGERWDVREYRQTAHDFRLAVGWPQGLPRGKGGSGGPRVIPTSVLVDYLEQLRHDPARIDLPVGRTTVKRLRRLLGHNWLADRDQWWIERSADLLALTTIEFAERYAVSTGAVSEWRQILFGKRLRDAHWWSDPEVLAVLALSTTIAADRLQISAGSVRRLRAELRRLRELARA